MLIPINMNTIDNNSIQKSKNNSINTHTKTPDTSLTNDKLLLIGYKMICSEIETNEVFINRLIGSSRIYFSICSYFNRLNESSQSKHFNLRVAWSLIARSLNDVETNQGYSQLMSASATVIYCGIQILGNQLQKTFGKQFIKLISCIKNQLFQVYNKYSKGWLLVFMIFAIILSFRI